MNYNKRATTIDVDGWQNLYIYSKLVGEVEILSEYDNQLYI